MTEQIVSKLNDLYVLYRKKFLLMDEKGYITIQASREKRINLADYHLKNHLHKKKTVGVFAGSIFSKFICFDVDIKEPDQAKMAVYTLVNALQEMSIPDENIYISLSGSKGYHVEIFFDKPVQNVLIKQFYLMAMNHAGLLNLDCGEVELRPTDSQGVKIPLGKHFKTDKTCWYCDYEKNLEPIKSFEYILTIQQLETEYFYDLMNRASDYIDITVEEAEEYENVVIKHNPLKIYSENIDKDITIEAIEKLISNGLTRENSRHTSLMKIAKYNKYFGMSISENISFLIKWLAQQDASLYDTKWKDCIKDIESIVKWVYDNNCSIVMKNIHIIITPEEMNTILSINGKNDKVVLYTLLIHQKRYGLVNGMFYMSYGQMEEATGLCENTLIKIINDLSILNVIDVIKDISGSKKFKRDTNRYRIKINHLSSVLYNDSNVDGFTVCDKKCDYCFSACLFKLLNKADIKKILPRRQYESFLRTSLDLPCMQESM